MTFVIQLPVHNGMNCPPPPSPVSPYKFALFVNLLVGAYKSNIPEVIDIVPVLTVVPPFTYILAILVVGAV